MSRELIRLLTETPRTWEEAWKMSDKKPNPKDAFWRFRPPFIDPKKDPFGSFHYTQKSVELLDRPLNIDEMVSLYNDLGERKRAEGADRAFFDAERLLLTLDIIDLVADRVKRAKYSKIASQNLFTDHNLLVEGVKIGDRYREADAIYPSIEWPYKMYVKGKVLLPSLGAEVSMWMGPHKTRWKEVDTSDKRSGVLIDSPEGPIYYWWFDAFGEAVNNAARKIGFRPSEQITPAQELKIIYTQPK